MNWHNGLVEWTEGQHAYISVVFSWQLGQATARAVWLEAEGYQVHIGGPAAILNPERVGVWLDTTPITALHRHNPNATFTTRGCIRKCPFCAVPLLEGDLVELSDWEPKPIVCDNNLLAASQAHFNRVIDSLKPLKGVDFNQGLDARLLTNRQAERLAELDLYAVRLAWDHINLERSFMDAFEALRRAGIPLRLIRVYVLIGYHDTPDDALYRLDTVCSFGIRPNPMRYQPIHAERRNEYVDSGWTDAQLNRYMRYWSRLRWLEHIPFAEYKA